MPASDRKEEERSFEGTARDAAGVKEKKSHQTTWHKWDRWQMKIQGVRQCNTYTQRVTTCRRTER